MSNVEAFWDSCAEKYAKKPIKRMDVYEHTMARTRAHLKAGDTVLEIGCGTGSTALLLAPHVKHITATDISGKMISIGQRKAKEEQISNVEFVRTTLDDDTLRDGTYDAILAYNFLHLLEELPGAFARMHRLLKPGGLLISKTICMAEQTRLWRIPLFVMERIWRLPRVGVMTINELEAAMIAGGFDITEAENHSASPPSRFIVAKRA